MFQRQRIDLGWQVQFVFKPKHSGQTGQIPSKWSRQREGARELDRSGCTGLVQRRDTPQASRQRCGLDEAHTLSRLVAKHVEVGMETQTLI